MKHQNRYCVGLLLLCATTHHAAIAAETGMSGTPTPETKLALDELQRLGAKPLETLTPDQARKQPSPADAVVAVLKKQGKSTAPEAVGNIEDRKVPVADLDTYDRSERALTRATNAIIVSSHYRQGPEHKFPTAHDDTYQVYRWLLENAKAIGADDNRIAIVGESAGGNMAASIAYRAKLDKL